MIVSSSSSSTAAQGATNSTSSSQPAKTTADDQFMQILLAQLRNQNPLEPLGDKDMIAQMVQLNSLMELQDMNANLSSLVEMAKGEKPAEGNGT